MREHSFRRQPQEALLDLVEARACSEDDHLLAGSLEVTVDPVLLERVEGEVRRFEDGRLMRAG